MFSQFFASLQQDAKLFLFFPILCALFRAIFIKVYSPYPNFAGKGKILWHTFRYGFWWGMDFNAYVFLISLVLVSLPGAFFPAYFALGNTLRLVGGLLYALVLYLAFMGKMLYYSHFHDIYNQTMRKSTTSLIFSSIRTMVLGSFLALCPICTCAALHSWRF